MTAAYSRVSPTLAGRYTKGQPTPADPPGVPSRHRSVTRRVGRLVFEEGGDALARDAEELGDLVHGVAVGSESGGFSLAKGCADVVEGFDVGGDEGGDARGRFGFDDFGETFARFEAGEEVMDAGLDLVGAVDVGLGHVVELAEHLDEAASGGSSFRGHRTSLETDEGLVNKHCRNDY